MATTTLGRKPSAPPASDAGFGLTTAADRMRTSKLGTASKAMWAYRGGARIGKVSGQPNGPVSVIQENSIARDRRKKEAVERAGFRLLVLWEKDIRERGAEVLLREGLGQAV